MKKSDDREWNERNTPPAEPKEGWENIIADLIDKEAVECGGINHEPDCQAMKIISLVKDIESKAYERGKNAIKVYPMKVCYDGGKIKSVDVDCSEVISHARTEERKRIIEMIKTNLTE